MNSTQEPHPFSPFIRILGRGKKSARALTSDEAQHAMQMLLEGQVRAEQIGAFLMLLRIKEESSAELAGFVRAVQQQLPAELQHSKVDLNWPSYAGKKDRHPWYLLAALALAQAGYKILMHGCEPHSEQRVFSIQVLRQLGIHPLTNWSQLNDRLQRFNFAFAPLKLISPTLQSLMAMKPLFGLRSPINTLARLINPCAAQYSLSSVFHPAYIDIQLQAQQQLQQPYFAVFKGQGGEIECRPEARQAIYLLEADQRHELILPRLEIDNIDLKLTLDLPSSVSALRDMWRSNSVDLISPIQDPHQLALATIIKTLSACLALMQPNTDQEQLQQQAVALWQQRDKQLL